MNDLESSLKPLRRRIRHVLILRHAVAFGAVGTAAAVAVVIISKKFVSLDPLWIPAALIAAGLIAGTAYGSLRRLTPFAVARAAENRLDLKERLSTSVRLSDFSGRDEMVDALLLDSIQHLGGVTPKDVFPHTLTPGSKMFGFLCILLVGLIFLPQIPAFQSKERRLEVKVMKEEGKELVKLAKEIEKKVSKDNEELAKSIAQNMKALGKQMESGRMTKKRAMLATKKLSMEIEEAQKKLADRNMAKAGKSADDAGRELQEMGTALDPETAEKMASMQFKIDELSKLGNLTPEQLKDFQKLAKKLSEMKSALQLFPEMLAKLADALAGKDYQQAMITLEQLAQMLREGKFSPEQMKQLAKELRALAEAIKGTPFEPLTKELKKAAEALEKGNAQMAAASLEKAAKLGAEIAKTLQDMDLLAKAGEG